MKSVMRTEMRRIRKEGTEDDEILLTKPHFYFAKLYRKNRLANSDRCKF